MNIFAALLPGHASVHSSLSKLCSAGSDSAPINTSLQGGVSAPSSAKTVSTVCPPFIKLGVTALIRDRAGRVLLGRKSRAFTPELVGKWVTPGGRVNYGESLTAAIVREVREETGYAVKVICPLAPKEFIHEKDHFVFIVFSAVIIGGHQCAGDDLDHLLWCDHEIRVALHAKDLLTPLTVAILEMTTGL